MLQLIDTICYENGELHRLNLHDERISRSRKELFGSNNKLNISDFIQIPLDLINEKVKIRVTYSAEIEKVEYEKYVMRPFHSLKLINGDHIDYSYKYSDRSILNDLFLQRGNADDILIIKDGFITDTSYANIVCLKDGIWFTPSTPLLKGTRRESYLLSAKISSILIRPEDLEHYSEARIINAMISLEQSPGIRIENITW